jgi:hypothetical protein
MRHVKRLVVISILGACGGGGGSSPDAAPHPDGPAPDMAPPDAPPEPKPDFVVDGVVTGQLAIDDAGIRATFTTDGQPAISFLTLFLTATGAATGCEFTIAPKFVMFDTGSTSTRQFKTVVYDVAGSTVVEDKCHFDDAYVLAQVQQEWGTVEIGFAQARFAEDRPNVDVFYDATNAFPNDTANIVRAGGGRAFAMAPDGSVDSTKIVEPAPGTLLPAAYVF